MREEFSILCYFSSPQTHIYIFPILFCYKEAGYYVFSTYELILWRDSGNVHRSSNLWMLQYQEHFQKLDFVRTGWVMSSPYVRASSQEFCYAKIPPILCHHHLQPMCGKGQHRITSESLQYTHEAWGPQWTARGHWVSFSSPSMEQGNNSHLLQDLSSETVSHSAWQQNQIRSHIKFSAV